MAGGKSSQQDAQVFEAFTRLVELIESVVVRGRHDQWQMPLLCLVSEPTVESPLTMVEHAFATEERRVPHIRVDARGRDLRALLHDAYVGLATGLFGADPLRFRHYALAEALMQIDLTGVPTNRRHRELARQLRRDLRQRAPEDTPAAPPAPGGLAGLALWLAITALPRLTFWLLTKGWLFGAGRSFRWFMGQRYLAPELAAGNFVTFASRLTVGARDTEDQEQIDLLLVHAFLQDLRVEYRRRPWRLRPWRRTAYPVVLLDHIAPDNGGYRFVQLVNDIRNDTGQSDPLLVIANSHDVPPDGLAAADARMPDQLVPLGSVKEGFGRWYDNLPGATRTRKDNAWYLPVEIPPADLQPFESLMRDIAPPRAPRLAHPAVPAILVLCVLAAAVLWQVPGWYDRYRADCGWPPWSSWLPWRSDGLVRTEVRGAQCIGYSDHRRQVFSQDQSLKAIQEKIFEQNRAAERAWRVRTDRPFVTLVYLGSLTKPDAITGEETFAGEREELQGMALAQFRAYEEAKGSRASPYLRIVVANAGQEMEYSTEVVRMLSKLAREEPTLLGVIGLVESRAVVRTAIRQLGEANLPVIVPTLSADRIADASSKYLQISASNADESQFVHRHVTQVLKKTEIFNYYTFGATDQTQGEENDLYVNTLREGLRKQFGDRYQESYWREDVDLRPMCPDRFPNGVVFFGGRYGNFGAFASALASACSGNLPMLIGNDSVNRYMANEDLRRSAPENLPVAYVVKGALSYCDQLDKAQDTERTFFHSDAKSLLSLCESNNPIGERVGLAYDATRMPLKAVRSLASSLQPQPGGAWRPEQVNPVGVHAQIRAMADPYQGVTGLIRFSPNGIAVGKRLTMLCVPNIKLAFETASDVPREIDRYPDDPMENSAYGTPPPVRRACTGSG